jgi:hypothetical protein
MYRWKIEQGWNYAEDFENTTWRKKMLDVMEYIKQIRAGDGADKSLVIKWYIKLLEYGNTFGDDLK